jgi:hypothetical protein
MTSPNELGSTESLLTSLFPGEVVTRALVRDVELPCEDQGSGEVGPTARDRSVPARVGCARIVQSSRRAADSACVMNWRNIRIVHS